MPARPLTKREGPSLFPFLSVLFCLLGSLMFLGVCLSQAALSGAVDDIAMKFEIEGEQSHRKQPVLVECVADTAYTPDGSWTFESKKVGRSSQRSTPFRRFLAQIDMQDRGGEYVLFLVRPNGLETFEALSSHLDDYNRNRRQKVDFGKELLPFGWKVRLEGLSASDYEEGTI